MSADESVEGRRAQATLCILREFYSRNKYGGLVI